MKIKNLELVLTRYELINLIENENPDKNSDWSKEKLLYIICNFENFSVKQYEWILSKVKYIINHNNKYKNFRKKFNHFDLEDYTLIKI